MQLEVHGAYNKNGENIKTYLRHGESIVEGQRRKRNISKGTSSTHVLNRR